MTREEQNLAKARMHMAAVVTGLGQVLGTVEAAKLLLADAVTLFEAEGGPALAVRYLRTLADEVERTRPYTEPEHN
jgi:hypothetical protein